MTRQHQASVHDHATGTNRREVLFGAGGLAAVAAAMGGQTKDRENQPGAQITGSIDGVGQFEVLDLSTGANASGGGGGGANVGRLTFQDVQFTKVTDTTSPKLLIALAVGRPIKNASFSYSTRKGSPAIRYDLENVQITSLSIDENTQDRPTETVMVSFSKIQITVDGVSAGYDLGKGTTF